MKMLYFFFKKKVDGFYNFSDFFFLSKITFIRKIKKIFFLHIKGLAITYKKYNKML